MLDRLPPLLSVQALACAWVVAGLMVLFGGSRVCVADNGSAITTSIVSEIQVDGQLEDWPAEVPWVPLALNLYGDPFTGELDFQGSFAVGVDPESMRLFVGVRVEDDSFVPAPKGYRTWTSNDAPTVHVALPRASGGDGEAAGLNFRVLPVAASVGTQPKGKHFHEYCFDLKSAGLTDLNVPQVAAFSLGFNDKDKDGSFSVIFWSPEISKSVHPSRRGDLILCGASRGTVEGTLGEELSVDQVGTFLVDIESVENPLLRTTIRTKSDGTYNVDLPPGAYRRSGVNLASEILVVNEGQTTRDRIDYPLLSPETKEIQKSASDARATPGYYGLSRASGTDYYEMSQLNGMPDSKIRALAQDTSGLLWIGTESNLACFDGTQLRIVKPDLVYDVNALWHDENSRRVWIAGRREAGYIEGSQLTLFPLLENRRAQCVGPTHDERVCFGTVAGLFFWDENQFEFHSKRNGLPSALVRAVQADPARELTWVGTDQGLAAFDGESYRVFGFEDGLTDPRIISLFLDSRGVLWIGTASSIFRYDGSFQRVRKHESERERYGRAFEELADGTVIAGVFKGVLEIPADYPDAKATFSKEKWPNDAIVLDRDMQLWQGFEDGGLRRTDLGLQNVHRAGKCRFLYSVGDFLWTVEVSTDKREDGDDKSRVVRYHKVTKEAVEVPFLENEFSRPPQISSFLATKNGVWLGTRTQGVFRLVDDRWQNLVLPTEDYDEIASMMEDSQGTVWIASRRALYAADGNTVTRKLIPGGPHDADFLHILQSPGGGLTVATTDGIYLLDKRIEIQECFESASGPLAGLPAVVAYDKDQMLWVANNRGLHCINESGIETYCSNDGLLDDRVSFFVKDWKDELWCGSYAGVNRIAKNSNVVQNLVGLDGLGQDMIYAVDTDGDTMWLGGDSGIWRYRAGKYPPKAMLKDVIANESKGPVQSLAVTTDLKKIRFRFGATSLKNRHKGMIYRYRLNGLDANWKRTSDLEVSMAVPPTGAYQFQLVAVDRDLLVSELVEVDVQVTPPYARLAMQWGLILASTTCVVLGLLYFARTRQEKSLLEQRVEERTAQLSDMELQLQHSQRLEALGTLASGVAHDFNNSLLAITANAELALLSSTTTEKDELVSEVLSVTEQAAGLTRSMLMFGGRSTSEKRKVDIREAVRGAEKILRRTLPASIEFDCQITDQPIYCEADLSQIQQVVLNLALNARDAMEDGGKLSLQVYLSAGYAHLLVSDTGSGMSQQTKSRIFEPFYTEKPRGKGNGLGLSVVHAIVRDHDATIHVQSEVGHGTEFRISFSAATFGQILESEKPRGLSKGQGRVLLADDQSQVRESLAQALNLAGFSVETAEDGVAFVRQFSQSLNYDLVIVDVDMPGKDGWQSLQEIRELRSDVSAIVMSGLPVQQQRVDAKTTFIRKPFSLQEITDRAAQLADD